MQFAEIDFDSLQSWKQLVSIANHIRTKGDSLHHSKESLQHSEESLQHSDIFHNEDDAFYWLFLNFVEPKIRKLGAIVLKDYPSFQASYAALYRQNEGSTKEDRTLGVGGLLYAKRFEVYIGGVEIANAFYELACADEQEKRMLDNLNWLTENKIEHGGIDRDFIRAVEKMNEGSGVALGVERLLMCLRGEEKIFTNLYQ